MKPGDHPDFFRLAPPEGTSRESSIVLDREGRFWHEGARVENEALEQALRRWIAHHPDDGRPILTNGYDWCYFKVEDAAYIVTALHVAEDGEVSVLLFDGSEEPLEPGSLSVGEDGIVRVRVKGGRWGARFSRHAQTQLGAILVSDDPPAVRVGGQVLVISAPAVRRD